MNKLAIVFVAAQLLLACAGSEPDAATDAPAVVAANPSTTTAEPASSPEAKAAPLPVPPAAPVVEPRASAIDVADPVAVAAYCAQRESTRPQRGSITTAAKGDDVTARFGARLDDSGASVARLVLHVAHAPAKRLHAEHGRERSDAWTEYAFSVASNFEELPFTVGTYDGAANEGSTGGLTCWAADGVGGGTSFRGSPVRLVITKRTDTLVEGTFDDTAFSAVITTDTQPPPEVCCL